MSGTAAERFQIELGVSPLLARLLERRGWREVAALRNFLTAGPDALHAPQLLLGMEAAVTRILAAVAAREPIRILGDYDADGTLATVILRQALRTLGAEASYWLPERLGDGYGLRDAVIERAVAEGVRLAITVDTGIREVGPLRRARELDLDVIVTDHHLPGEELPPAVAVINPHQPGCAYPEKNMCGSAVAFKLAQALLERRGQWTPAAQRSYLKLVALGTIADAMPLLGENRAMTRAGLAALSQTAANAGLRALLTAALPGYPRAVKSGDVSFRIAPRLNAAGRMGSANQIVDLFSAPPAAAVPMAQALEALNTERKRLCAEIEAAAATQVPAGASGVLLFAGPGWHRGVLGIVATRLLAQTGQPVLVAAIETGEDGVARAHGSGRAPAGFHLLERLDACRDLFDRYGGHAQAVGFSLPAERLPALREAINDPPVAPMPASGNNEDFELRLGDLTLGFARELERLEPWGEANREPVFRVYGAELAAPPTILKDKHAKLLLAQDGCQQTALIWNLWRDGVYQARPGRPGWDRITPGARLDLRFRLERTAHPQFGERLQLVVEEFSMSATASAATV